MFRVRLDKNNWVIVNSHKLFNVKRPFRFYRNRKKCQDSVVSLKSMLRKPSETFKSKQLLRYSVCINEDYVGRLFTHYSRGFKCHSIYGVERYGDFNASGHALFRSKAIQYIIDNLHKQKQPFINIKFYLQKIIERVCKSYGFRCCIADSLSLLKIMKYPDLTEWNMTKIPKGLNKKTGEVFTSLLSTHEKIPLNCLDYRVLKHLTLDDIEIKGLDKRVSSYLFLTTQNNYFAGYVGRVLMKEFRKREVLPLTLFAV